MVDFPVIDPTNRVVLEFIFRANEMLRGMEVFLALSDIDEIGKCDLYNDVNSMIINHHLPEKDDPSYDVIEHYSGSSEKWSFSAISLMAVFTSSNNVITTSDYGVFFIDIMDKKLGISVYLGNSKKDTQAASSAAEKLSWHLQPPKKDFLLQFFHYPSDDIEQIHSLIRLARP